MYDNVTKYFFQNVLASYKDYVAANEELVTGMSQDMRLAENAAKALYHIREYIPKGQRPSVKQLAIACPDFRLLKDVANATKHSTLDPKLNPDRMIDRAADIAEQIVRTEYQDEFGDYCHVEKVIVLKLKDGSERMLHEVLTTVLNMWIVELQRLGILGDVPLRPTETPIPTRMQANDSTMGLTIMPQVDNQITFSVKRYNYETKKAEPVDLTDHKFEMAVYAPEELIVNVEMTHPKTGHKLTTKVPMDLNEQEVYFKLKTHEEKVSFVKIIGLNKGIFFLK